MTDNTTDTNRRRVLEVAGGALLAGLAGCLGGGGSGGQGTAEEMTGTEMTEAGMTETGMTDTEMAETTAEGSMSRTFGVRIENVATGDTLQTMDGSTAVPLSPGAFVVHADPGVLFEAGEAASAGLERVAEDGMPGTLAEELGGMDMSVAADAFDTPAGADSPGPIGPGDAYEFEVTAPDGARLSFATMFIQSNDLFYAPSPEGIALYAEGEPISGSVTDQVALWDAGTEVNEPPGEGPNQAPRQSGMDTGDAENGVVRRIAEVDDGYTYPAVADVLDVTVSPMG